MILRLKYNDTLQEFKGFGLGVFGAVTEDGASDHVDEAEKNDEASGSTLVSPIGNVNVEARDGDGENDKENAAEATKGHLEGAEEVRFDEFEASEGGEDNDGVQTIENRFNLNQD